LPDELDAFDQFRQLILAFSACWPSKNWTRPVRSSTRVFSAWYAYGRFYQPDIFAEIGDTKRPCLAFG